MKNYACLVSYLGMNYAGFQRQPSLITIQGKLEECLSIFLDEEILIKGAGRTDSGVNALGQVFTFKTNRIFSLDKFSEKVNDLLPKDIYILHIKEVDLNFDARHSSVGKEYLYKFSLLDKNPLELGRVSYLKKNNFDFEKLKECLKLYEGEHDFKNFTTKKEDKDNFIRKIEFINIAEKDELYEITLKSNGFMTYMVRILLGVAFKVAYGKISLEEVSKSLDSIERKIYSFKAEPGGLYLKKVHYLENIFA